MNVSDETPDISVVEQLAKRIFSHTTLHVERVRAGVSTYVYRIDTQSERFYLRILPEKDASFAPEVRVHQLLREQQVNIPEIVYFEHYHEALARSVMVTTEIQGTPVSHCHNVAEQKRVLIEAGKDLARINSLPVKGFGWIRRDSECVPQLQAEHLTYRAVVHEHLEADLVALETHMLASSEVAAIHQLLHHFDTRFDDTDARLVHGDFDVTHIYQERGCYTGIIDFGEIRGMPLLYDLGHCRAHDGEILPTPVLPYLFAGYREVAPLPADYEQSICFLSLLIAIRMLARTVQRSPHATVVRHMLQSVKRDIHVLLM